MPTDLSARSKPDACPGALRVHRAADGGLVRVRIPGGTLSAGQLEELSAAAAELGEGSLQLTSRANLQIRGLPPGAEVRLAGRLAAAGLLPSATHERVRNIVASPLSGCDGEGRLDVHPLVAELDRGLCAGPRLAELPGRFLFTVDDGRCDVAGLGADVGLLATGPDRFALLLAGADTGVRVSLEMAVSTALACATAFLDERGTQASGAWRLAELPGGVPAVLNRLGAEGIGETSFDRSAASGRDESRCVSSRNLASLSAESSSRLARSTQHDATAPRSGCCRPAETGREGDVTSGLEPGCTSEEGLGREPAPCLSLDAEASNRLVVPAAGPGPIGNVGGTTGPGVLVVGAPLGRLTGEQSAAIAALARDSAGWIRVTPWRSVVIPAMSPGCGASRCDPARNAFGAAGGVGAAGERSDHALPGRQRHRLGAGPAVRLRGELDVLARLGLVADPSSPLLGVTACTGRPGCASALADVRADALRTASANPASETFAPPLRSLPVRIDASLDEPVAASRSEGIDDATTASPAVQVTQAPASSSAPQVSSVASTGPGGLFGAGPGSPRNEAHGLPVHWVGCEHRCGRPVGRAVEVLATADGYEVSLGGASCGLFATADEAGAAAEAARRA